MITKEALKKLQADILRLEQIVAPYVPGSKSLADSPESLLICLREYVAETKKILVWVDDP